MSTNKPVDHLATYDQLLWLHLGSTALLTRLIRDMVERLVEITPDVGPAIEMLDEDYWAREDECDEDEDEDDGYGDEVDNENN